MHATLKFISELLIVLAVFKQITYTLFFKINFSKSFLYFKTESPGATIKTFLLFNNEIGDQSLLGFLKKIFLDSKSLNILYFLYRVYFIQPTYSYTFPWRCIKANSGK